MQALRRLFYRNRSITDGDGRHFIKRENGIERALAGADGVAVMRVHAAAVAWHVDYSAVLLIDKQVCRKCVPCIAVAGGLLTAFGILKRCFAINRVDKVIADRREQDFIDRCGFATYLNRLTGSSTALLSASSLNLRCQVPSAMVLVSAPLSVTAVRSPSIIFAVPPVVTASVYDMVSTY